MKKFLLILSACGWISFNNSFAQVQDHSVPPSFQLPEITGINSVPSVAINTPNMMQIDAEDSTGSPMGDIPRIGVAIAVHFDLTNSGQWTQLPEGGRIWRLKIKGQGARAIGLYYDDFFIPPGAKLYVYNEGRTEVFGGLNSESNPASGLFATPPLSGQSVIVEYYEPASVTGQGHIRINEIGYVYRNWDRWREEAERDFGDSESCQVNVNCAPEGNGKTQQRDAVMRIMVKVGSQFGWCTGSMVNTTSQSCTPYALTALHCGLTNSNVLTTAADLNQWQFFFKYQSTGCPNPGTQPTLNTITGCTQVAHSNDAGGNTGSDFLLLQLNSTPPATYNIFYAGWNRNNTSSASGYGIHHPAGDIKKISTFTSALTSTSWGGSTANTHWQVTWAATTNGHGVTEGGSSGSPLFNGSGQIVGTLTGGGSFCTSPTSPDAYGKFSYHWLSNGATNNRRLAPWLDPGNTGLTSMTGIYAPCSANPLDAGVIAILNPPAGGTICTATVQPQVIIQNFGTATLTAATINYRINTGTVSTFSWAGSLATGSTDTVTLPNTTFPTGAAFTFRSYTTAPNAGTDANHTNDTTTITAQYEATNPLPYVQAFNNGSMPTDITVFNPNGDAFEWEHTTSESAYGVGTGSVIFDNYSGTSGSNPGGTIDWLILPTLDFSAAGTATLTFDVAYARYNNTIADSLIVAVATACGTQYQIEYIDGGTSLATAPNTTSAFAPTNSQWENISVDLSAYTGEDHVSIAFINLSDWGNNIYVDNINVSSTANCNDTIINVNASICAGQSYNLPWGGTATTAGTYSHTYTTALGCDSTRNIILTVNALPNVSGGSNQTVCAGQQVTLSGSGANTYTWTGGVSNGVAFTPASTSTYTVTGTNTSTGCSKTATVTVTVNPLPNVGAGSNQSVCPGTSVTLSGSGAVSYTWTGGVSNGVPFVPAATQTYTVTGTAANTCTKTATVTVTVHPVPPVSAGPDLTVCTGGSVTLSGSGANTYAWSGGVVNGVPFTPASTQTYTVTGTASGTGCTATDQVLVTVTNSLNVNAGPDLSVCAGQPVTLTATGAVNYSWTNGITNGQPFSPATTQTYIVTGNDGGSCFDSDTVQVTVLISPTVFAGSSQTVCEGTSVTLAGSGAVSYAWTGGVSNGVPFVPAATQTYTVTGTAANTCTGTSSVTITVNPLPNVSAGVDQSVCTGQSVTLTATGALSYSWTGGVTNGAAFIPSVTATYTVTGTDANTCSNTDAVIVTVNPVPAITINTPPNSSPCVSDGAFILSANPTGGNFSGNGINGTSFNPATAGIGTHTITYTFTDGNGCQGSSQISIQVLGCVGIDEAGNNEQPVLYPNPGSADAWLKLPASWMGKVNIKLYSLDGKIVESRISTVDGSTVHFGLDGLSAGVYIFHIEKDGQQAHIRWVKQ